MRMEPLSSLSQDKETMEHKIALGRWLGYELVSSGYAKKHRLWYAVMKKKEK